MTINLSEATELGSFALVTYVPKLLGAFLQELRRDLPGEENPEAHITVLPPRPLKTSLEMVSREAQRILSNAAPFWVGLDRVNLFSETNILYLEIAEGNTSLHALHRSLNVGTLAHQEDFDFQPHLTISGPVPGKRSAAARAQAQEAWKTYAAERRFQVAEVVALVLPVNGSWKDWNRVWVQRLGKGGKSARASSVSR
jgi:2'-5' RNA ligase